MSLALDPCSFFLVFRASALVFVFRRKDQGFFFANSSLISLISFCFNLKVLACFKIPK